MSSTMCGMPIMRSMSQVTTASAFLPPSAAAAPSTRAMTDDTHGSEQADQHARRQARHACAAACRAPSSRSRRGARGEGARFFCGEVRRRGGVGRQHARHHHAPRGDRHDDTSRQREHRGCPHRAVRVRCRTPRSLEPARAQAQVSPSGVRSIAGLPPPRADAGVHDAVQHVRDEVAAEHERRRHAARCPPSSATSPPRPAVTAACPRPGIREHLLHEHRAAEDLGDGRELQRERRQREVAQPVMRAARPTWTCRAPARSGRSRSPCTSMVFSRVCSAMFATPTTESVSAGSARWCSASAQRHVGRRHADGHREPEREPPEPHREHDEEHEPEPERGRRRQQEAVAPHDAGRRAPRFCPTPAVTPSAKPMHAADAPRRRGHERERS